jgi:DNA-binding response OmpR family regulator
MGTQRDQGFLQRLAQRLFTPTQLHVLIVDPDLGGARQLASALGHEHMVTVVGTATAAFTAIQGSVPMLVVIELDLPDASGLDMLARLHTHPATQRALLMVLTRRSSIQDKIAAFQAGADDFLVKPVDPQTFAAHVKRLARFRQILPSSAS